MLLPKFFKISKNDQCHSTENLLIPAFSIRMYEYVYIHALTAPEIHFIFETKDKLYLRIFNFYKTRWNNYIGPGMRKIAAMSYAVDCYRE